MKNFYMGIMTIIALSLFAGCNTTEFYIDSLERFVSKTEHDYTEYDMAKWEDVHAEFKKLTGTEYNKYKDKLTDEEKTKIDKLKGRYYSVIAKYKATELQKMGKSISDQVEGFLEGLMN